MFHGLDYTKLTQFFKGNVIFRKQLPVVISVLWDIRQDANRLRPRLEAACNESKRVFKWFSVKLSTAGTKHRVLVIPTRRLCDLLAATKAVSSQNGSIHRPTLAQRTKVIPRVKGTGIKSTHVKRGDYAANSSKVT